MQNRHILVVDDNQDIRDLIGRHLKWANYRVTLAEDAEQARVALKNSAIDLVVLDIMMPGEDGLSLCRYLSENSQTPVLLLSALAEGTDRITGLEVGADDYLTKPFEPKELLARVNAILRRTFAPPPEQQQSLQAMLYQFAKWQLNSDQKTLLHDDGLSVPLSTSEYRMLLAFLQRPRVILSRDQLLDLTQGRAAKAFDRSIDNCISRLRRKIEHDPKNPELICTQWGGGYSFNADVKEQPQC
ncbi:response regulator [Neiella marina]|uniref:Response regulator n=1 Tax=Neiella holothuriorum TaxID=2870530 RepID=A0ABS7EC66_9GAMM|nr:response regulator [Neiella holothuriorum]MBW8189840.1 response regulator [Neiella holothuriorum]